MAAPQDGQGSRNNPARLHLNLGLAERNPANDANRPFPTTPSTFPQPVYQNPNAPQEVWGTGVATPTGYPGGPPNYFAQAVYNQANSYQQNQALGPNAGRPATSGYGDGTNGLINQFSHQNLNNTNNPPSPRSASPLNRQPSPANARPRTAGATANPLPSSNLAAPPIPGLNGYGPQEDNLPHPNIEKYSDNVFRRNKLTKELAEGFFKENVQRAKDRNQRAVEFVKFCKTPELTERQKQYQLNRVRKGEAQYLRFLRTKEKPENYATHKIIGKGAFGEVKLVSRKADGKIYALKCLIKAEMRKRDQLAHVRSERDILAEADSPWVVTLHTTFQDPHFLYMLMEFLPGGDLMTMLIKYEIFSEDITRFYMAELALALEAVHIRGFIHRDIKPDNILLDRGGHIKLTDFGLSTGFKKNHDQNYFHQLMHGKAAGSSTSRNRDNRNSVNIDHIQLTVSNRNQINTWRKSRRMLAYSTVGTPDYIAPEIFTGKGYGQACDWWSVGAIAFECLIGWPPFCAEESGDTYRKIVDWQRHLHFPPEQKLSDTAEGFVRRLLCDAPNRLGTAGDATEIKQHPFFRGVVWDDLRRIRAPFEPKLTSSVDTQYFPVDEIPQVDNTAEVRARDQGTDEDAAEMDYPFHGYTYRRFDTYKPPPG